MSLLAALLTAMVLVPIGWAAMNGQRDQAEAARRLALQAARLAEVNEAAARDQAQRNLVEQAADAIRLFGDGGGGVAGDKAESELFKVSTEAVTPEIPRGAHVLIDKQTSAYLAGDIVVYRVEDKSYLGRAIAVDQAAGHMTVGRNGEANRQVEISEVIGRGVLNTR